MAVPDNRSLNWFWTGRFASAFGNTLATLVVPFYLTVVLHLDPISVSLVMAGPVVATLLSPLYAGVIADSTDRKVLAVCLDGARGVALLLLASVTLFDTDGLLAFGVINFVVAIITATYNVSLMAGFPDIVGDEGLHVGNARLQTFNTVANSAGGLVGGAVMSFLGPFTALVGNAATYLISCLSLTFTRWPDSKPSATSSQPVPYLRRVLAGFALVSRNRTLSALVLTSTASNFFITLSAVALLWLLVREIQLQYFMYVVILAVGSLGAAVGSVLSRRIGDWLGSSQRAQLLSLGLYALLLGGYGFLGGIGIITIVTAATIDFGIGVAVSVYIVNNAVQQQRLVISRERGGVGAVRTFGSALARVCGTAFSGVLIAAYSGRSVVLLCAAGLLVIAVAFAIYVFRGPVEVERAGERR